MSERGNPRFDRGPVAHSGLFTEAAGPDLRRSPLGELLQVFLERALLLLVCCQLSLQRFCQNITGREDEREQHNNTHTQSGSIISIIILIILIILITTVLCLELVVLLQFAKVLFSLLLQRCDTTLQSDHV